jgi:TonB family protein
MYWKHFGLSEDPFSLTADRRFLFLTDAHRDVLANLRESMESERGFAALIGSPGVGKTTLLYELIEQLRESTVPVFIVQTHVELIDILQLLLRELGQEATKVDATSLHQRFAEALKQVAGMGKRFLLVIDEVQALNPAVLETIRLLSNIELGRKKIVEAVFAGQSDFEELLARPNLQVLKQRIAAYGRLKPFTKEETHAYVLHRLRIAGAEAELFTPEARDVLAELSHGVARTINIYAFQALHAAIRKDAKSADSDVTRKAIYEFEGWPLPASAPVLARRAEPVPESKPVARVRDEDDDYFESGKDAGLQALLASLRNDRSSDRETSLPETPVRPAPVPAVAPAVAKSEPIPFSIAAVLKATESMPMSVSRTAAAVAPAYEPVPQVEEKVEEVPTVAEPAPSKFTAKAPMLIVQAPVTKAATIETKPEVIPVPAVRAPKATSTAVSAPLWQRKQAQLVFAISLGLLLLVGAAAFAYNHGSFTARPSAEVRQPAAGVAPAALTSLPATTATTNAPTDPGAPAVAKPQPRTEEPRKPAPTEPAATEIAAGKAPRLNEAEPAPAAPVSLGAMVQPNLGSALVASSPVALARRPEQVKPAVVIAQPKPIYPDMAARLGVTGTVVLRVQVSAQGKPTKVDVISGPPMLAAAAQNTIMSGWRFSPATIDGKKVESETEVRINFKGSR